MSDRGVPCDALRGGPWMARGLPSEQWPPEHVGVDEKVLVEAEQRVVEDRSMLAHLDARYVEEIAQVAHGEADTGSQSVTDALFVTTLMYDLGVGIAE